MIEMKKQIIDSFEDFVLERITNNKLFELGYNRVRAEKRVCGMEISINNHLVKLLKWKNIDDYETHLKDIENKWVSKLDSIYMSKGGRRLKKEDYYNWLYDEPIGDNPKAMDKVLKRVGKMTNEKTKQRYDKLPVLRVDEEVHRLIELIIKKLSILLSEDRYDNFEDVWYSVVGKNDKQKLF